MRIFPGAEDPGFESCLWWKFSGSRHTSDLNTGTPVAILPDALHSRVSTGIGWASVSILWLSQMECWSATSISVWQHVNLSEQIYLWETLACCWDAKQASNQQTNVSMDAAETSVMVFLCIFMRLFFLHCVCVCVCVHACVRACVRECMRALACACV